MARAVSNREKAVTTAVAWIVGLLIFFPIIWIVILSLKTEVDAIRGPIEVLTSELGGAAFRTHSR